MKKQSTLSDKAQEAIEAERRKLLAELIRHSDSVHVLESGYSLRLHHKHTNLLMRVVKAERECCQFLSFDIAIPAGLETFDVTVSGPGGTREFLDRLAHG